MRTAHFAIHFPRAMQAWALDLSSRLESERAAVVALVGYEPPHCVTVIVDDPFNVPNGFALPFLRGPVIFLWPTPPQPEDELGQFPLWDELVSAHEFAHIAHLTRPSRNPFQHTLWALLPDGLGPIPRRSPRWLMEGYATYIEGRVTGSGRPRSVARATILRTFALAGRLPSYGELDAASGFEGGSMAYLVGSAFLEWLVSQRGEASLTHLWRRMTARIDRGFVAAFAGVYGGTPQELYGRFTADLTGKALEAARALAASGIDTGVTVQRLRWYTGAPALSPDGQLLAIALRTERRPTRIVVWKTTADTGDRAATARARARLLARDPEDVPAIPYAPRPKQPVATLAAANGRSYDAPRFLPDGRHLLVIRDEPLPDGALRSDLFLWDAATGHVRRITHGAGINAADPMPDGESAVATRCLNGICDLVRIDLRGGALRVLVPGSPARAFAQPRAAPDGRTILVSVHAVDDTAHAAAAHWRLALVDTGTPAALRPVGPGDGASRYAGAFLPGGRGIVAVSEDGGVQHLERIDLETGAARPLAAALGGTLAPDPSSRDSSVYFLSIYAEGLSLNRIARAMGDSGMLAHAIPDSLRPVVAPTGVAADAPLDTAPREAPPLPVAYGAGPRQYRFLPGGAIATDGRYATLLVGSTDPIGRLGWTAQGALGDASAWRGAALSAVWRDAAGALPGAPSITASLFGIEQRPSRQRAGSFAAIPFPPGTLDADARGVLAAAGAAQEFSWGRHAYRLGGSAGAAAIDGAPLRARSFAFAEYGATAAYGRDLLYADIGGGVRGAVGGTDGLAWQRVLGNLTAAVGIGAADIRGTVTYGAISHAAPPYEQFVAGGGAPPLTDSAVFAQRVAIPALPLGTVGGRQLLDYRIAGVAPGPVWYYEAVASGPRFRDWARVVGMEQRLVVPSVAFAGLPTIAVIAGGGYSLTAPFRHKLRGYITVSYAP